jgi:sulfite reductase (ferredoxin)
LLKSIIVENRGRESNMSDNEETTNTLMGLGTGEGSKAERVKSESHHLRGQIAQELAQDTTHFSEAQVQLIKFHGIYQQENRDVRQTNKAASMEKAYQFMVRSRIPGGVLTAEQYLVEDDLAGCYANGTLRITTRQGFQLHGLIKGDLHPTIHAINEALLSTLAACGDVNRNVMACPAPIATRAQAQVQAIAHHISMHLAPRSHAYHEIWIDGEQVETVQLPQGKDVYNIYLGGDMLNTRLNTLYAASVHLKDLAATIRPLLALWRDERVPGENFGDFCYRVGMEYLHTAPKVHV